MPSGPREFGYSYGIDDASYRAAGELAGLTALVNAFYDKMDSLPEAAVIRALHPADLTESRRKLTFFLSGWLGGPKLYSEHYGPLHIPAAHRHLPVGEAERDAWLLCMRQAIAAQPYEPSFGEYLIVQLGVPAERIRQVCSARSD